MIVLTAEERAAYRAAMDARDKAVIALEAAQAAESAAEAEVSRTYHEEIRFQNLIAERTKSANDSLKLRISCVSASF